MNASLSWSRPENAPCREQQYSTTKFDVDERLSVTSRPKSVGRKVSLGFVPDLLRLLFRGHHHVVDDVRAVDGVYGLLPIHWVNAGSHADIEIEGGRGGGAREGR